MDNEAIMKYKFVTIQSRIVEENELQTRYVVVDLKKLESFGKDGTFGCVSFPKIYR